MWKYCCLFVYLTLSFGVLHVEEEAIGLYTYFFILGEVHAILYILPTTPCYGVNVHLNYIIM